MVFIALLWLWSAARIRECKVPLYFMKPSTRHQFQTIFCSLHFIMIMPSKLQVHHARYKGSRSINFRLKTALHLNQRPRSCVSILLRTYLVEKAFQFDPIDQYGQGKSFGRVHTSIFRDTTLPAGLYTDAISRHDTNTAEAGFPPSHPIIY